MNELLAVYTADHSATNPEQIHALVYAQMVAKILGKDLRIPLEEDKYYSPEELQPFVTTAIDQKNTLITQMGVEAETVIRNTNAKLLRAAQQLIDADLYTNDGRDIFSTSGGSNILEDARYYTLTRFGARLLPMYGTQEEIYARQSLIGLQFHEDLIVKTPNKLLVPVFRNAIMRHTIEEIGLGSAMAILPIDYPWWYKETHSGKRRQLFPLLQ